MRVIAVVLNWRRPDDTIACVRSVLDTAPDTAVIVVDNASDDGSVEQLRAALPGVTLLVNEQNLGYAGGNNVGIRAALAADADAVFILNNDVIVQPGCIQVLARATAELREAYHCLPLGPLSLRAEAPNLVDFYRADVDLRDMAVRAIGRGEPAADLEDDSTAYVTGSALFAHRQLFEHVGFFDERYFLVWEDVDFCLRARKAGCAGHPAQVLVDAKVLHRGSPSFGEQRAASPLYQYCFVRNSFLIARTHVSWPFKTATLRRIEQRYRGWISQADDEVARAIELGIEHGLAGRYGPPPGELMPQGPVLPPA